MLVDKFRNNGLGKCIDLLCWSGQIDHPEYDGGLGNLLVGAFDPQRFDGVCRMADAGSIDETEGDPVDVDRIFDHVACGTVNIGNNRFLLVQKQVQQGGLSGISFTDDRHRNTILNRIAQLE